MPKNDNHKVFSALGDPTRQRIVELLADGPPVRISDLAEQFSSTRQAVTKHVNILCAAGVMTTEKRGRERFTRLADDALDPIADWLSQYNKFWGAKLVDLKKLIERREIP